MEIKRQEVPATTRAICFSVASSSEMNSGSGAKARFVSPFQPSLGRKAVRRSKSSVPLQRVGTYAPQDEWSRQEKRNLVSSFQPFSSVDGDRSRPNGVATNVAQQWGQISSDKNDTDFMIDEKQDCAITTNASLSAITDQQSSNNGRVDETESKSVMTESTPPKRSSRRRRSSISTAENIQREIHSSNVTQYYLSAGFNDHCVDLGIHRWVPRSENNITKDSFNETSAVVGLSGDNFVQISKEYTSYNVEATKAPSCSVVDGKSAAAVDSSLVRRSATEAMFTEKINQHQTHTTIGNQHVRRRTSRRNSVATSCVSKERHFDYLRVFEVHTGWTDDEEECIEPKRPADHLLTTITVQTDVASRRRRRGSRRNPQILDESSRGQHDGQIIQTGNGRPSDLPKNEDKLQENDIRQLASSRHTKPKRRPRGRRNSTGHIGCQSSDSDVHTGWTDDDEKFVPTTFNKPALSESQPRAVQTDLSKVSSIGDDDSLSEDSGDLQLLRSEIAKSPSTPNSKPLGLSGIRARSKLAFNEILNCSVLETGWSDGGEDPPTHS